MRKLNNKGFAITTTIYGLMIILLISLLAILAHLRTENKRVVIISEKVENNSFLLTERTASTGKVTSYVAPERGKYYFTINGNNSSICYVYLPKNATISIVSSKLVVNNKPVYLFGGTSCNNNNITNIALNGYYAKANPN